jgi:putative component of membrane protein insertase Oxa1/YidC/SpoIIIJ protein YidD
MHRIRNALVLVNRLAVMPLLAVITVYQFTLSPDHGLLRFFFRYGVCKHSPTCSQFAINILKKRFLPIALFLILKRVASCNPWAKSSDERLRSIALR